MNIFTDTLLGLLGTILTSVAAYIGIQIKNAYTKFVDTKTKKEIVTATVGYVEQVSKTLEVKPKAEDKFRQAKYKAQEWLSSKGIIVSDSEIEILIENAVNAFNQSVK